MNEVIVTIGDAEEHVLQFGLFKGKTIGELMKSGRGANYIGWLSTRKSKVPKVTKEAVRRIMEVEANRVWIKANDREKVVEWRKTRLKKGHMPQGSAWRGERHQREVNEAAQALMKEAKNGGN